MNNGMENDNMMKTIMKVENKNDLLKIKKWVVI